MFKLTLLLNKESLTHVKDIGIDFVILQSDV